ncbi:MAG: peptidoglycan synthetase [Chitinophagales bacterium]|nr:peptidoglycan synthetase [Chitinophagales bacterium]
MAKYHFIAIGGAVMHQLALHLKAQGNIVTGSDDAIFDPAKTNLAKANILPNELGWFPEKITSNINAVILGMHAKADNPELLQAQALNIPIYSFPAFIYETCKDKNRVVVAGSHGKTTITAMIMHILLQQKIDFDYLVGAQLDGFEYMVKTSNTAKNIIIEGDEYLTSPLDLKSKFLHYHPNIAIISGIAWDHINVFPTFESYLDAFKQFILSIDKNGYLIYNEEDDVLKQLVIDSNPSCNLIPYKAFNFVVEDEQTIINYHQQKIAIKVFGKHNLMNLKAAFEVAKLLGIDENDALNAISTFKGAAKRLELQYENIDKKYAVYRDFAHAPSKLKATVDAVKTQYPNRKIIAVFEMHTYSSLQENFIHQYKNSLDSATIKLVFLDEAALKIKGKTGFDALYIQTNFGDDSIIVLNDAKALKENILAQIELNSVLLLMSSGNIGGLTASDFKI